MAKVRRATQKFHHLDYIIQSYDEYHTCCGKELLNHFLCLEERQKEVARRSQIVWTVLCKRLSTGKRVGLDCLDWSLIEERNIEKEKH